MNLDVKDEILAGEPKYRIMQNDTILYDDVAIEMTTEVQQQGTPINKALFDLVSKHLIPTGIICMWSGVAVPSDWHLCDGTNGTPDLRNRFIVGAGNEYTIGDVGGEREHTLTVEEMANHTHAIGSAEVSKTYKAGQFSAYTGTYPLVDENDNGGTSTISMGKHTHTIDSTGGDKPHENRPPYYALAYIMKINE